MALLKCRHCQTEIDSNARKTRCPGCGQLFPFACAVCDAPLRPPFPVFEDERYLNADNHPLCSDHFQRQCPKCQNWFSADENPGYFLCQSCMNAPAKEDPLDTAATPIHAENVAVAEPAVTPSHVSTRRKPSVNILDTILSILVFLAVVAVVVILGWQIFSTLRTIFNF